MKAGTLGFLLLLHVNICSASTKNLLEHTYNLRKQLQYSIDRLIETTKTIRLSQPRKKQFSEISKENIFQKSR